VQTRGLFLFENAPTIVNFVSLLGCKEVEQKNSKFKRLKIAVPVFKYKI